MDHKRIENSIAQCFAGDFETFCEVVRLFESLRGQWLYEIEAAVDKNDFSLIERAVHQLKGTVALFHHAEFVEELAKVEEQARLRVLDIVPARAAHMKVQTENLLKELNEYISSRVNPS